MASSASALLIAAYRTTIGPDNIIANHPVGIRMDVERENIQNRITRNSIYDNGFGIDLHPYGVTPNGQYPTTGPNLRLPFPALSSASPSTVTGRACAGCTVEVFLADGGDNEYGQGRTFVGSAVATPDLTGAAVGSFTATVSGLAVGNYVTATATDANGNTLRVRPRSSGHGKRPYAGRRPRGARHVRAQPRRYLGHRIARRSMDAAVPAAV